MRRREPALEPELEALLNPRRVERRAPAEVRARAMARSRAIVAAGGRIPPISSLELAPLPLAMPVPVGSPVRLLALASFAAAVVTIGVVVALRNPTVRTPPLAASAPPPPSPAVSQQVADSAVPPQADTPPLVTPAKPARSVRPERDVGTTELELLARAQSAYTQRDFTRAIALISELNRRFPNGHLAEEREALRVRSLLGAGRTDEGQRAAAAFAARFPRSVLLPKPKL
ncbi:MAG: hypothetical protein ABW061_13120 [Polyangiaceae bacterium]